MTTLGPSRLPRSPTALAPRSSLGNTHRDLPTRCYASTHSAFGTPRRVLRRRVLAPRRVLHKRIFLPPTTSRSSGNVWQQRSDASRNSHILMRRPVASGCVVRAPTLLPTGSLGPTHCRQIPCVERVLRLRPLEVMTSGGITTPARCFAPSPTP